MLVIHLALVVETLDSTIHRINHYPAGKYYGNQLRHPLDSDLFGGWRYPTFEQLGPDDYKNSPCMLRTTMLMSDCFPVFLLQFLLLYKNVDVEPSTFQ